MTTMRYDNPFPGMNPYLEQPRLWPGVHNGLIAAVQASLGPQLPPQYRMEIDERFELNVVWPADDADTRDILPDLSVTTERAGSAGTSVADTAGGVLVATPAPVRITYLLIRRAPDDRVVTVVEILSPSNKLPGRGRADYVRKREDILASPVNLVEIDLLRVGEPMPLTTPVPHCHYSILVSREQWRPSARLFPFMVCDSIPRFRLPLLEGDEPIEADIGPLLAAMHHTARYNMAVSYDNPPPAPALEPEYQEWVRTRLGAFQGAE